MVVTTSASLPSDWMINSFCLNKHLNSYVALCLFHKRHRGDECKLCMKRKLLKTVQVSPDRLAKLSQEAFTAANQPPFFLLRHKKGVATESINPITVLEEFI